MASTFGRNPTEICLILIEVVDHVFDEHSHRIQSWEQPLLSPVKLQQYADAMHNQGALLRRLSTGLNSVSQDQAEIKELS